MIKILCKCLDKNSGTTVIEYALIAGVFGCALIFGYKMMGNNLTVVYHNIDDQIENGGSK